MIFAAGLGTRLRPLTDTMPKALVPVAGETLLGHVVKRLRRAGCDRIVVNVHHFARQITDYLRRNDNFGIDIRVSDESEMLLDTGGGLKKAAPLFRRDEPILIHNVDIISNVDINGLYDEALHGDADAVLLVSSRQTTRYLLFDDDMNLTGWKNVKTGELRGPIAAGGAEKPRPASVRALAFSGIHVISARLLDMMNDMPDRFSIIDFYLKICGRRRIKGLHKTGLRLLDVGKTDTLAEAGRFIAEIEEVR